MSGVAGRGERRPEAASAGMRWRQGGRRGGGCESGGGEDRDEAAKEGHGRGVLMGREERR
jgi:hypothetical protein